MSDPRTDLPAPGAPNFNQRLREVIQTYLGRQGNPLDRGLTLRDLVDTGVLKLRAGFQLKPGAGSSIPLEPGDGVVDTYEPDLTPPPTPGNMTVTASISHVMIEHEAPLYRQGHGHLRTRVYGKVVNAGDPLPTFADAAEIGQFSGTIYAQPSNPATTWRLWIKWETNDGVLSVDPAGGINGMEAVTGQDVALLLEALSGKITSSQLYADLNARIDLIDGPAETQGSVAQRLSAEASSRANAILAEAQARDTAIQSLQTQINMLSAAGSGDFTDLLAAVQEEQTARISGDAAEATARETLAARVTGNEAALQSQASQINDRYTKAEADSAISSSSQALSAAYQAADAAALSSAKAHADAGILAEQTARANADSALASSITTLGATVNSNNTTLSAAIQNEATARANADAAVSRSVSTLQASAGTGGLIYNGSFANGSAEGWTGLAGVSSTPYGGLPKAYAGVQISRDAYFPDADTSQWMSCRPGDEFEVSAWVSAEHVSPIYSIGIQYEKTDGSTDNWVPISSLAAPTTAKFLRGYWTAPIDARRLRFWGHIDTPHGTTVNAWGIADVQLRRTDERTSANKAAIQTEAEVRATQTGDLYAKYGVKLDVNGYMVGWAMNNNGSTGDMIVLADTFAVGAPGAGNIIPFVVNTTPQTINGVDVPAGTYMDAAYIKNGTITSAKIGNLAVDDAKIASLSVEKLTAGFLQIGSWIASSNYASGTQGWAINSNGTAEFSGVIVRGTVYASAGEIGGVTVASNAIRSGQTAFNTGQGFYLASSGKMSVGNSEGSRLTWDGEKLIIRNSDASRLLDLGATGTSSVIKISDALDIKADGTAVFSGSLSSASGTFSGSLTAQAVNAVNTINLAGQSITVPQYLTAENGSSNQYDLTMNYLIPSTENESYSVYILVTWQQNQTIGFELSIDGENILTYPDARGASHMCVATVVNLESNMNHAIRFRRPNAFGEGGIQIYALATKR